MTNPDLARDLPFVEAPIAYLAAGEGHAHYRTWPPSSGRVTETPPKEMHVARVHDCRPVAAALRLDGEGFVVRPSPHDPGDVYDETAVRARYLPDVERMVAGETGALAVFAFDYNLRSARAVVEQRPGVRPPADMAHNDYTESSGPRRVREILSERGRLDLADHRAALINVWRPIEWPARDVPLGICEAASTSPGDFVDTDIEHFGEADLERPRHTGQIFSIRYNPAHRWFFVSDMRPDESLIFKCWDSVRNGFARYTAHTGFRNPAAPPDAPPRRSIEVRTLAIYPA